MAKKKIFISFDYENDKNFKFLLEAWNANQKFDFSFFDVSTQEVQSWDISRIKAAITPKINSATHTLIIVGKHANDKHKDSDKIGFKNWINWEISQSKAAKNKLVGVKIDKSNTSPDELLNAGASWAYSYTVESIVTALDAA